MSQWCPETLLLQAPCWGQWASLPRAGGVYSVASEDTAPEKQLSSMSPWLCTDSGRQAPGAAEKPWPQRNSAMSWDSLNLNPSPNLGSSVSLDEPSVPSPPLEWGRSWLTCTIRATPHQGCSVRTLCAQHRLTETLISGVLTPQHRHGLSPPQMAQCLEQVTFQSICRKSAHEASPAGCLGEGHPGPR
jgi:hypothetical protein